MKSIHVRDVEENVLMRLKRRAALHHRSLQGELHAILEDAAEQVSLEVAEDALDLIVVDTAVEQRFSREEMYGDDAR